MNIGVGILIVLASIGLAVFYFEVKYSNLKKELEDTYRKDYNTSTLYSDLWENSFAMGTAENKDWANSLDSFNAAIRIVKSLKEKGTAKSNSIARTFILAHNGTPDKLQISFENRKDADKIRDAWGVFCDTLTDSLVAEKDEFVQRYHKVLDKKEK